MTREERIKSPEARQLRVSSRRALHVLSTFVIVTGQLN